MICADSDILSSLLTPLVECPCIGTVVYNRISVADIDLMKGTSNIGILRKEMGDRVTILSVHDIARIGRNLLRLKLARERYVVATIETVYETCNFVDKCLLGKKVKLVVIIISIVSSDR